MLIKVQVFKLSLKDDVNIYSIIKLLYCCRVNCFYYVIYVDNVQIKGYLYLKKRLMFEYVIDSFLFLKGNKIKRKKNNDGIK